jgi:hypothetical protein
VPLKAPTEARARPVAPTAVPEITPAVRLGFTDGSSVALDDLSQASRDLIAVAGVLVHGQPPRPS